MSAPTTRNIASICDGLQRSDDREKIADALTQVAAMPCSPEGLRMRASMAEAGGLESIMATLLASHGDVRLQCKAANALGSLCMSEHVARGFPSSRSNSAVLDRLGDMVRSRSQWAQADAVGCLGWLVGSITATALHKLVPLVTQLMVKHTVTDDEVFIQQETEREERSTWDRDSSNKRVATGGGVCGAGGADTGGRGGQQVNYKKRGQASVGCKEEVARERMDNIRVYSLIFLLKASHADASTMPVMVEAGALRGLLRHLAAEPLSQPMKQVPGGKEATFRRHETCEGEQGADEPPSLVLAARLLYTFSSDPDIRASLLQAKCLPPLIRIRQRLQQAATATATLGTTLERERFRQRSPHSEEMSSAVGNCSSGKGATADQMPQRGSYSPGEHGGDSTRRCRNSNVNVTANGDLQPSLAVIISLVIDKVVDKTPSRPGGSDRRAHA